MKILAGLAFLFLVAFVYVLGALSDKEPSYSSRSQALKAKWAKEEMIQRVRLEYKWRIQSGTIMTADFIMKNENTFGVKDITVTCQHVAPSGTKIDSNQRTIYEAIGSGKSRTFKNFNMGFIHSQASGTRCEITDLLTF